MVTEDPENEKEGKTHESRANGSVGVVPRLREMPD